MDDVQRVAVGVGERVRVSERSGGAAHDERGVRMTERALAAPRPSQDRRQRLAGHRLHRKEVAVLVVPHLDDARDVRVVEQRPDARLVEKHAHELIIG